MVPDFRTRDKLFLGVFILILAMTLWRITGNFWGWLALFIPGAWFVVTGLVELFRD